MSVQSESKKTAPEVTAHTLAFPGPKQVYGMKAKV